LKRLKAIVGTLKLVKTLQKIQKALIFETDINYNDLMKIPIYCREENLFTGRSSNLDCESARRKK